MDYQALRNEIESDPTQLGYAALVAAGSDAGVADLLNQVGTERVNKGEITTPQFFYDFGFMLIGVASITDSVIKALFEWSISLVKEAGRINLAAPEIDGLLTADPPVIGFRQKAVAVGLCTDDQWSAVATRAASRAEILFGAGTVVSSNDVAASFGRV